MPTRCSPATDGRTARRRWLSSRRRKRGHRRDQARSVAARREEGGNALHHRGRPQDQQQPRAPYRRHAHARAKADRQAQSHAQSRRNADASGHAQGRPHAGAGAYGETAQPTRRRHPDGGGDRLGHAGGNVRVAPAMRTARSTPRRRSAQRSPRYPPWLPKRRAKAAPATHTARAISRVERTWPAPAMKALRAVSRRDQPCWRAITVIGTQWSGTMVCSTPIAATAPIRRNCGAMSIVII